MEDGSWIATTPPGTVRLNGNHVFQVTPKFIPVPPSERATLALFSSSLVNGFPVLSAPAPDLVLEGALRRTIGEFILLYMSVRMLIAYEEIERVPVETLPGAEEVALPEVSRFLSWMLHSRLSSSS